MQAAPDSSGAFPNADGPHGPSPDARRSLPPWVRPMAQAARIALAALLAYAIWRAYQNPDLLLDLSAWRMC